MKVVTWEDFGRDSEAETPLAAAVGVFDGLHGGHRRLIERVLAKTGLGRCVVTFRENPKKLLRPSTFHGDLVTLTQKLDGLEALGLELCVLIDFSGDFSKLAGRNFLSSLRERGNLRFIAVGSDFRCGYRLDTSAEELRSFYAGLGVEAEILDPVPWSGHPISSSRIRKAVVDGRLGDARAMMGRSYELDLRDGDAPATEAGRLWYSRRDGQVSPPRGRYEAELVYDIGPSPAKAAYDGRRWVLEPAAVAGSSGLPWALRLHELVSRE